MIRTTIDATLPAAAFGALHAPPRVGPSASRGRILQRSPRRPRIGRVGRTIQRPLGEDGTP